MKYKAITFTTIIFLALNGCGSIVFISEPEALEATIEFDCQNEYICEECFVIPISDSSSFRDIKWGYYYDQVEEKCKHFQYSSGPGCIPAPFKTIEECVCCCMDNKNDSKK